MIILFHNFCRTGLDLRAEIHQDEHRRVIPHPETDLQMPEEVHLRVELLRLIAGRRIAAENLQTPGEILQIGERHQITNRTTGEVLRLEGARNGGGTLQMGGGLRPNEGTTHRIEGGIRRRGKEAHRIGGEIHRIEEGIHQIEGDIRPTGGEIHQIEGEIRQIDEDVLPIIRRILWKVRNQILMGKGIHLIEKGLSENMVCHLISFFFCVPRSAVTFAKCEII